jgi:hypothetical protein
MGVRGFRGRRDRQPGRVTMRRAAGSGSRPMRRDPTPRGRPVTRLPADRCAGTRPSRLATAMFVTFLTHRQP